MMIWSFQYLTVI